MSKKYYASLNKIVSGAFIGFILGMAGYLLMFLFKVLVARTFSVDEYGQFEMIVTILGVLTIVSTFGLTSTISRYVPYYIVKKKYNEFKGFNKFTFVSVLITSLLVSILSFIFSDKIVFLLNLPPSFVNLLKLIVFFVPFKMVAELFSYHLQGHKKIFLANFSHNVLEKVVLLTGVILSFYFDWGLYYLVLFLGLSSIFAFIFNLIAYLYVAKKIDLDLSKIKATFLTKEWLLFSIPLFFSGILAYLINWTDNFVVGGILGTESLGLYGVAYSLGVYVFFIPGLFGGIFAPVLTELKEKSKTEFIYVYKKIIKWVFLISAFFSFVLIFFSKQIITILFGSNYSSGYLSLSVLATFFLISVIFYFNTQLLIIFKKTRFILFNNLFFVVLNLVLNLIFIKIAGIFGVALASGLSMLLMKISEYIKMKNSLKYNNNFFFYLKTILAGGLSIIFVKIVFSSFFNSWLNNDLVKLGSALIIYSFIFITFIFIFKILEKDDLDFLIITEKRLGLNLKFIKKIIRKFI